MKPLGRDLKGIGVFAGATIMGDGRVGLILDVMGLAHRANVMGQTHDRRPGRTGRPRVRSKRKTPLRCCSSPTRPAAGWRSSSTWSTVWRSSPRRSIERSGPETVVQYRDEILPLVDVSGLLPEHRRRPRHNPDSAAPHRERRADRPGNHPGGRASPGRPPHRRGGRRGSSTSSSPGWTCSRPAGRASRARWSSTTE